MQVSTKITTPTIAGIGLNPLLKGAIYDTDGFVVEIKHKPGTFDGDINRSMIDKHPRLERIVIHGNPRATLEVYPTVPHVVNNDATAAADNAAGNVTDNIDCIGDIYNTTSSRGKSNSNNDNSSSTTAAVANIEEIYAYQKANMLKFYKELGGTGPYYWIKKDGWDCFDNIDNELPFYDWHGVGVNRHGLVSSVELGENNLRGTLGNFICNIQTLVVLKLNNNEIIGSIPREIGNLTNLKKLSFTRNKLTGPIPESIGRLTNLVELSLRENNLNSSIPESIGNLVHLKILWLERNNITGKIPASIGNLTKLTLLWLTDNQISDFIPDSILSLSNLLSLGLENNKLVGEIPEQIGNLSNLRVLSLGNNLLGGPLPNSICEMKQLTSLWLDCNLFTGDLPIGLGSLSMLKDLRINGNLFTPSLPISLGDIPRIDRFLIPCTDVDGNPTFPLESIIDMRNQFLVLCFYTVMNHLGVGGIVVSELTLLYEFVGCLSMGYDNIVSNDADLNKILSDDEEDYENDYEDDDYEDYEDDESDDDEGEGGEGDDDENDTEEVLLESRRG